MSSRQLRKLQKQRELEQLRAPSPSDEAKDESEEDAPIKRAKPSAFSGFAALGGQDDGDDDDGDDDDGDDDDGDDDEDDNDDEVEPTERSSRPAESAVRTGPPNNPSKKSKKKKKKKKGKKPDDSPTRASRTDTPTRTGIDDIDEALRELDLSKRNPGAPIEPQAGTTRSTAIERICELLRINTHHLRVVNEMRNLFGREAIAAAMNEENEERARLQHPRNMPAQVDLETFLKGAAGKALPEITLRRNPFLPGKDSWPRAPTEGLTMRQSKEGTGAVAGTVEFGFVHDEGYNKLEQRFFDLVQQFDPMQLVYFVHDHPYHISSLIQVSKVAKQDQNSALSADLCERALFTFGRVALSGFRQKMEEGKARLDFSRPENRQFWLAGYHYLKNLVMKGTYRTALEWAKLLFSMDLTDPYGMIHFIHPMAIRAYESKWFIDFCDSEALDNFDTAQDYIRQTLVLARLQQKDTAGAKALLLEGMERLPWLYSSLYKALNLDVPRAIWGMQPRDDHEDLFVELYVHQTRSLWDNAQVTSLLKEAARVAKTLDSDGFGSPPVVGRNVARFVYLDNTPSLMGHVPGGLLSTSPNWEFDPVPPLKEDNIFSYDSQQQPWMPSTQRGLRGFDIPRDPQALRQLLRRVREGGAPPEVEAAIQEAIAQVNQGGVGDEDDSDEDGGDDGIEDEEADEVADPEGSRPRTGRTGLYQTLMDLFLVGGQGGDEDDRERLDDRLGLAYSDTRNRMPGAWDDSEEEMPELIPSNENNATGNAADDVRPGLEPAP